MSKATARDVIDWIFDNVPRDREGVKIEFIGGEPLLEFELIKDIFTYTNNKNIKYPFLFFATTNGTVLTDEMKAWFLEHKDSFWLGLSLDGTRVTHNYNRSNSFDNIDVDFFCTTWPEQSVKMTLSEYSLEHLSDDVKFTHSLGFNHIGGCNLFEGNFNWNNDVYIQKLIMQLKELSVFYINNETYTNQLFDKTLDICESKQTQLHKRCGIGTEPFFDFDGKMYPCAFVTPMTFQDKELELMSKFNFNNDENYIDEDCVQNCYIYPICSTCYGANYMINKSFNQRDKSRCRIYKLIILFIADMQSKKIINNPELFNDKNVLFYTIEAIKKIKNLYLGEYESFYNF